MPAKKKPTKKEAERIKALRKRILRFSVGGFLTLVLALLIWMYAQASVVYLSYTDVYLNDLPKAFDGATVLYVTDLHMDSLRTPGRTFELLQSLAQLQPDILLIGGDFASIGLGERIIAFGNDEALAAAEARRANAISELAELMAHFPAPLGKYAVMGEEDGNIEGLREILAQGGVGLMVNEVRRVEKDGEAIYIAGLDNWTTGEQNLPAVAELVRSDDCVVLMSHNPDVLPALNNQIASGGGRIADLVLAGHTHSGQVRLFGKSLYGASPYGDRYRSGWYHESGTHMLVSGGIGAVGAPLRLNASPQAHLITLKCIREDTLF